jgi:hypothetical protein
MTRTPVRQASPQRTATAAAPLRQAPPAPRPTAKPAKAAPPPPPEVPPGVPTCAFCGHPVSVENGACKTCGFDPEAWNPTGTSQTDDGAAASQWPSRTALVGLVVVVALGLAVYKLVLN